jgi:hypothetical protein
VHGIHRDAMNGRKTFQHGVDRNGGIHQAAVGERRRIASEQTQFVDGEECVAILGAQLRHPIGHDVHDGSQ